VKKKEESTAFLCTACAPGEAKEKTGRKDRTVAAARPVGIESITTDEGFDIIEEAEA
jgi:hypothetical protein